MYLSIIFLPLLGSLLATNRFCGKKGGIALTIGCKKLSVICCIGIFYEVGFNGSPVFLVLGNWINFGNIFIEWNLLFDNLTILKYLPIVFISFLIQVYSLEYMGHDPYQSRFFSLLSLFTFTMLVLVTGENLLIILLGWEGVGLVSYLLVNFWFTRIAANKASLSALFLNKIGDLFFILALVIAIGVTSDLSLATIFSLVPHLNGDLVFLFTITIIGAASAKSALIPLHTWLPKAMEGPTSVSALLHSSTKVTAGVYLLKRISPILEFSSTSLKIIIWLGSLGALFGAACGKIDNDIKRVIAMSTTSQLGYKIVAVGISQYNQAMFHLFTHAFFKSLLFQASGAVLHAQMDNQDIRKKGSLNLFLPLTYLVFFFASISLMAFPFTSGWYSKDLLIELLIVPYNFTFTIAYIFTLLAAFLTSFYSIRLMMIVKLSRPGFPKNIVNYVIDSPIFKTLPLIILSFGAVMLGYLTHELFLAYGSTFYKNSLFTHPSSFNSLLDASFHNSILIYVPILFLFLFNLQLFINPNKSSSPNSTINYQSHDDLNNSHKFTQTLTAFNHFNVLNHWFKHKAQITSHLLYRYIDKGILELFGPQGLSRKFNYIGFNIELLSTGFIPHYVLISCQSQALMILFI